MEIIHISAELAPIAKVGGLADVLHGLSRSLIEKGHRVKIILPKYDLLDLSGVQDLEIVDSAHSFLFEGVECQSTLWLGRVDGIDVIFFESHDSRNFFNRDRVYGCHDDISRFLYFSAAALEYAIKQSCDIIHIHDWHTAIIASLIKKHYPESHTKTVFTIHNFAYQGVCVKEDLKKIDDADPSFIEGDYYNLIKCGIIYADHVTTVSPSYAHELLNSPISGGLQQTLQKYAYKFSGIVNGIDYHYWNPQKDPFLPANYSSTSLEKKEEVKKRLKKQFSLCDCQGPLVCAITRLVHQKGPELIKAAILRTVEWGGQFILVGSALDDETMRHFLNLKEAFKGSHYIHFELTYNEPLSHLVFAGSDLFIIPSIFEPCGLTQLIAMRYGTIPLARETGGLIDTVIDGKNGFTFGPPVIEALHGALDRAFETWYKAPQEWERLQSTGMAMDFSWNKPANAYLNIYNQLI